MSHYAFQTIRATQTIDDDAIDAIELYQRMFGQIQRLIILGFFTSFFRLLIVAILFLLNLCRINNSCLAQPAKLFDFLIAIFVDGEFSGHFDLGVHGLH